MRTRRFKIEFLSDLQETVGAPFKPSFGLSGIMDRDVHFPSATLAQEIKIPSGAEFVGRLAVPLPLTKLRYDGVHRNPPWTSA